MRRSTRFSVMAAVAIVGAIAFGACSNTVPTTATTPTMTTDTFSGTLTLNGAQVFTFSVQTAGTLTASLTTVSPDSTAQVGLALGTWNGSACQVIIANDGAVQGVTVTGTVSGAGTLCVRVYDAKGTLPNNEDFTITVVHP
jgi:hypothetical protein